MSIGICFEREKRSWMQDQWSWLFSNFDITEIWERDKTSAVGKDYDIYQPTTSIISADELPTNKELIILSPIAAKYIQGNQSLKNFVHPENAIYFFGPSHGNMDMDDLGDVIIHSQVYIPTHAYEIYSHAAAYITLYDRYVKRGSFG